MIKRIIIAVAAFAVLGVFLTGLWLWDPLSSTLNKKDVENIARAYDVEIIRDSFGVPHIFGNRDSDAAFGLAYAHAEDDFETIQEVVAATRGHLSRYRGAEAAPTDYLISLMGIWETVDSKYETGVPQSVKNIAEAYAAGLNLYAVKNKNSTWQGLAPFTAKDVIAGFVFKTPLFYGLDETLLALFGDTYKQQVALDSAAGQQSFHIGSATMAERGSNAFAVSPERSGDDITRLLINSHQPLAGPVAWYEAHLVTQEGLDITGGLFPGVPVILHGFNRHLGWANTVNKPDLVDVYVLTINPDNPDQYFLDGAWVDFEKRQASFRVGVLGPFALPVKRPVLYSAHGPVIQADHGTYALRYAGMNEIRQLEQYYSLNKATDMVSFLEAMAKNALPSINYIYADKMGNIGFIHNGQFPNRDDSWNWSAELPGDRSDVIWQGYRQFSQVPMMINPKSGFLWNSNNTPMVATDGDDNLKREDFPQSMGLQDNMTNRSLRIGELTDGKSALSRDVLLDIKFDTYYSERSLAALIVEDVLAHDWTQEETMSEAAQHLEKWNYSVDASNRHAALGVLTTILEVTAEFSHITPPDRKVAFRDAVSLLMKNFGTVDVPWGQVNRLVRGNSNLPVDGGPDILRAIYPAEIGEDGKLYATAGDSWIAMVEWDKNGRISADVVNNFGSSSVGKESPHFDDQAKLFAEKKFRKALLTREDILNDAKERYNPLDK